ncbi:MAG: hypothetical protein KY455_14085, partial [Euryarchaeota archaeon]|nr:hypothetical protein [Euryarchaeota archaeon]
MLALVAAALSGGSPVGALSTEDRPAVPGAYTGPSEATVPEGWTSWASLSADGGEEEMPQCGKLKLVFRNPDLRPNDQGFVEAQGSFFIQFQAIGEGADEVDRFAFSFGATHDAINDNPSLNCNGAIPEGQLGQGTGGAYLLYYRSDYDKRDGFFVPILTTNVPDSTYGAAVHAYDKAGNEIARAWAKAIVSNCPDEQVQYCAGASAGELVKNDFVQPWPMVLPGDGEQTNDVDGLTIEFGEFVIIDSVSASINGVPLELETWENPWRDSDLQPTNDPDNPDHPMSECVQTARNVCDRADYGDGFKWLGDVEMGDVVRVSAQDRNGNLVVKTIHYGETSGGTVDAECPVVEWELLEGDTGSIKPGNTFEFPMRLANVGGDEAHVNLLIFDEGGNEVKKSAFTEAGWKAKWVEVEEDHGHVDAVHSHMYPGDQNKVKVLVETHSDARDGTYKIVPVLEYECFGDFVQRSTDLFLTIDPAATGGYSTKQVTDTTKDNNTTIEDDKPEVADSPAPGVVVLLVGVVLLAVVARRRRAL